VQLPLESWIGQSDEQTRVLSPPYRTLQPIKDLSSPAVLSPGAILVDEADNPLVALARLTAHIQQRPWLVPYVVISPHQDPLEPLLFLVSELRDRLAVVRKSDSGRQVTPSQVVEATYARKPPDSEVLAGWVGYRSKEQGAQCCVVCAISAGSGRTVSLYLREHRNVQSRVCSLRAPDRA